MAKGSLCWSWYVAKGRKNGAVWSLGLQRYLFKNARMSRCFDFVVSRTHYYLPHLIRRHVASATGTGFLLLYTVKFLHWSRWSPHGTNVTGKKFYFQYGWVKYVERRAMVVQCLLTQYPKIARNPCFGSHYSRTPLCWRRSDDKKKRKTIANTLNNLKKTTIQAEGESDNRIAYCGIETNNEDIFIRVVHFFINFHGWIPVWRWGRLSTTKIDGSVVVLGGLGTQRGAKSKSGDEMGASEKNMRSLGEEAMVASTSGAVGSGLEVVLSVVREDTTRADDYGGVLRYEGS